MLWSLRLTRRAIAEWIDLARAITSDEASATCCDSVAEISERVVATGAGPAFLWLACSTGSIGRWVGVSNGSDTCRWSAALDLAVRHF